MLTVSLLSAATCVVTPSANANSEEFTFNSCNVGGGTTRVAYRIKLSAVATPDSVTLLYTTSSSFCSSATPGGWIVISKQGGATIT
jgi:hypothetical protein